MASDSSSTPTLLTLENGLEYEIHGTVSYVKTLDANMKVVSEQLPNQKKYVFLRCKENCVLVHRLKLRPGYATDWSVAFITRNLSGSVGVSEMIPLMDCSERAGRPFFEGNWEGYFVTVQHNHQRHLNPQKYHGVFGVTLHIH